MKGKRLESKSNLGKMLTAVFLLCLLDKELSEEDFERLISDSKKRATKKLKSLRPSRAAHYDLVLLGSILHRWFKNPKYLDDDARPVPIRARGKSPSIEALFREEGRPDYFEPGLEHMRAVGMVNYDRRGGYLPTTEWALHRTLTPEMVGNLALTIDRMVSTLISNSTSKRKSAVRLIERTALVLDLPRTKLPEFKTFAQEQGGAFVSTMNDWLENRRKGDNGNRAKRHQTISAGIHVLAFVE